MSSLRGRLFAHLALAALASTVLTVAVAAVVIRHHVEAQRLSVLERQADLVAATSTPLSGTRVLSVGARGKRRNGGPRAHRVGPRRARALLARIGTSATASGTTTVRGHHVVYASRPLGAGRIVLVRPAGVAADDWRPFVSSLLLAGIGGALLAGLLAALLARRLTRPVHELAAATARVAAHPDTGAEAAVPVRGRDELAQLAQAFNSMSRRLAESRSAQRSFLLSVSHELKTPMTAIRGYAEALQEGAVEASDAAAVIAAETARLERLVGDLLDLARLDRHEFSIAREPLDIAAAAALAHCRAAPLARDHGVELRLDAPEPAWVLGDLDRLDQAAANLVENALRVTPRGGWVAIEARGRELTVRDSGPGIAADDLPRAFERFFLHERYAGDREVGSGLGLAIVRELATAMGGDVRARSRPGAGAEFTIELPTAGAPAAGAPLTRS